MTVTRNDFNKIWASTSSVPEYTFSDTDYKNGWEFVENLPPTRAMWDKLQKRNDEKMRYLMENGTNWVENVATLRTTDAKIGEVYGTKGYYAVNDGGQGFYVIRANASDTDDGGSIIILDNGNVAELITDGTVNVKQFGAKGDGLTDDTTAIANAISFSSNVFIPAGAYKITDINLTVSNKTIKAEGTIVASSETAISIAGDNNYISIKLSFDDSTGLYIDGDNNKICDSQIYRTTKLSDVLSKDYQKACVRILGNNNSVYNNELYNAYNGVAGNDVVNFCVSKNNIHDCMTGVQITGVSENVTVEGNFIHDIDVLEYSGSDGILVKDGIYRVIITGNIIDTVAEHGMYIQSAYTVISGNVVKNADNHAGIKLASYEDTVPGFVNDNSLIEENIIDTCYCGIVLQNVSVNTIVSGNSIKNISKYAIYSADVVGENYVKNNHLNIVNNNCMGQIIYLVSKAGLIVDNNQSQRITVDTFDNPDNTYPIVSNNIVYVLELGFALNGVAHDNRIGRLKVFHGYWNIISNVISNQSDTETHDINIMYIKKFVGNDVSGSDFIFTTTGATALTSFSNNNISVSGTISNPFIDTRSSLPPSAITVHGNTIDIGANNVNTLYLYGNNHNVTGNIFKSKRSAPSYTVQGGDSVKQNNIDIMNS